MQRSSHFWQKAKYWGKINYNDIPFYEKQRRLDGNFKCRILHKRNFFKWSEQKLCASIAPS